MLTRSLLRTKIAQVLYANINTDNSLQEFDNELTYSIKKSYDLYHLLLLLPQDIAFMAQKEVDMLSSRLLKTDENIDPLVNLAQQQFPQILSLNSSLVKYTNDNSISWSNYEEERNKLYKRLKSTVFFDRYINEDKLDFDTEKTFWRKFFRSADIFDDSFEAFLEEQNIYWLDDLGVTLGYIDKTLSKITEVNIADIDLLPMYKDKEESDFVVKLSHAAYLKGDDYNNLIAKFVSKWDIERITKMDMVLLRMAIAEFQQFPLIPINVTINEYIEIAKYYSTKKSRIFINGILDKIAKSLIEDGLLKANKC